MASGSGQATRSTPCVFRTSSSGRARRARRRPTPRGRSRSWATGGHHLLEVQPPSATGLPRKIVSVELGGAGQATQFPTLQLSAPLTVVGTVSRAASQTAVVGATVDFFALDSSGSRSVLIGSGLTNASGQYQAVLPDVPTHTDQPP